MSSTGFLSSAIAAGHPDFLDLPWERALEDWAERCARLEQLPAGPSRHPVVFVGYDEGLYALKQLPCGLAQQEVELLRQMRELGLPVVEPVGWVKAVMDGEEVSVLVTRYLERSLPYHLLFQRSSLQRYREHLMDAMANLLVQLHLAGVFWGDCSLYNTLFRRNAGALQAYLVDAETSEIHKPLGDGLRQQDLAVMEENVSGGLADLEAAGLLKGSWDWAGTARLLRERYEALWREITHVDHMQPHERYRIQQRVRALNAMGFSVEQIELEAAGGGHGLMLRPVVTDRNFHRSLLHGLVGLDVEELQARLLINEIREHRMGLSAARNRSVSMSVAAFDWLEGRYKPLRNRLCRQDGHEEDGAELYCQLLEHKWYLSERAQQDVGHHAALDDFLRLPRPAPPDPP